MAAQYGYIYIDRSKNPMKSAVSRERVIEQIDGVWVLKMNTTDNNAVDINNLENLLNMGDMGGPCFAIQTCNNGVNHRAQMDSDMLEKLIKNLKEKESESATGAKLSIRLGTNGVPTDNLSEIFKNHPQPIPKLVWIKVV